jgi:hypothetical protein
LCNIFLGGNYKKFASIVAVFLFILGNLTAQQKYLVSPNDQVIPLKRGQSASAIIAKRQAKARVSQVGGSCGNKFTFGYPESIFPANVNIGAHHRDVMGEWFVAKASGSIDTIFWEALGSVGAEDSTLYVRINTSAIGPTYGPGIYPYRPPCQSWGYFINTNDLDQGIAAFTDDATDTTWHSTINPVNGPSTRPPFGKTLWGAGGVPVTDHAGRINSIALADVAPLTVTIGQQFFFSQRVKKPQTCICDAPTDFAAVAFRDVNADTGADAGYPARVWKFFEYDSGSAQQLCCGYPFPRMIKVLLSVAAFLLLR